MMTYRATSEFWDGPTCYRPGEEINLTETSAAALLRMGKVEAIPEPEPELEPERKPEPEPKPRPGRKPGDRSNRQHSELQP
jgi:hypothetical protein